MNSYFYILLLSILPLFYKLSFWLYTLQLKNYRFDRFKEYLSTKQGKSAIFNKLFYLELIVLICWIVFFLGKIEQKTMYYILTFFLQFESLFVFYKIFTLKIIVPKKTWRMVILSWIILLYLIIWFYWGYFHQALMAYLILPALIAFPWLYVLFWNMITTIFFDFIKERKYLQASEKLKKYKLNKIWITWSYGKSSMKEYLATILDSEKKTIKTPENINTEIWIANFILNTDFSNFDYFVAEIWAYRKWEITTASKILNHKDWFLTWIGNQHIGLFGNQQNIIDAKCEIAKKVLENNGTLYLNNTNIEKLDENIFHIKDKLWIIDFKWKTPQVIKELLKKNKIVFYGKDIEILQQDINQTKFKVNGEIFTTNLTSKWQIENLYWAILYALNNWFKKENIQKAIKQIKQPANTMEIKQIKWKLADDNYTINIIDDTYNLSVNGLINAIDFVKNLNWKKIIIVDDILELGNQAWKIHYLIWKYIANKFDKILFVGINYKQDFLKWVKENNWSIVDKIDTNIFENTTILFEWKKAKKYIEKF